MTLILRLERDAPTRTAVLESAAAAALALCLDERAGPDGPWFDAVTAWAGAGRIRKLSRRARTAHWRAVQEIDGVTVGELVRALVPGPVDDVPHEVRRLQIGGTDLPPDEPGPPPAGVPVIWLSPEVEQTVGKAAAQVGHASMILATVLAAEGSDPARRTATRRCARPRGRTGRAGPRRSPPTPTAARRGTSTGSPRCATPGSPRSRRAR